MAQLASAADVRAHRFGAGAPFTLGVEDEYMLLDAGTFDLVQRVESILSAERDDAGKPVNPALRAQHGVEVRQMRVRSSARASTRSIPAIMPSSVPPPHQSRNGGARRSRRSPV